MQLVLEWIYPGMDSWFYFNRLPKCGVERWRGVAKHKIMANLSTLSFKGQCICYQQVAVSGGDYVYLADLSPTYEGKKGSEITLKRFHYLYGRQHLLISIYFCFPRNKMRRFPGNKKDCDITSLLMPHTKCGISLILWFPQDFHKSVSGRFSETGLFHP